MGITAITEAQPVPGWWSAAEMMSWQPRSVWVGGSRWLSLCLFVAICVPCMELKKAKFTGHTISQRALTGAVGTTSLESPILQKSNPS